MNQSLRKPIRKRGLSLLEVMLALSILGVSTAILSQILQIGSDNGLRARRITQAQMLCESKMNEILLSSATTQNVSWTPMTIGVADAEWYYQLQNISAEQKHLIGVVVSISDAQGIRQNNPPLARLVQWIVDPSLGLDAKTTAGSTESAVTQSPTSTSSGGLQ